MRQRLEEEVLRERDERRLTGRRRRKEEEGITAAEKEEICLVVEMVLEREEMDIVLSKRENFLFSYPQYTHPGR